MVKLAQQELLQQDCESDTNIFLSEQLKPVLQ